MKILLNKLTKDSDLKTGLQVCYKNIDGVFNNIGVITDIVTDKDGIKNYLINTAMGAYMADELKLIAPAKLNSVLVKFEDATNNYETSVSSQTTEITAIEYFVGKYFNIAPYPSEKACKCIGIEFTDNNL